MMMFCDYVWFSHCCFDADAGVGDADGLSEMDDVNANLVAQYHCTWY